MMFNIFSYAYLPLVYRLWWIVCSDLLLILKTGLFIFLLLSFKSSIYLGYNPLSNVWFTASF